MRNKTVYTLDVYKVINRQRVFSKDSLFVKGAVIAILINMGARTVYADKASLAGWSLVILATIVAPIAFFAFPLRKAKKNYEQSLKMTKDGGGIVNTIDFEKNAIVAHNNIHQTGSISYADVKDVVVTNKLIIIKKDGKELLHIDRKGFINATDDDCFNLLNERCPNLKKKLKKGTKATD